MIGNIKSGRFPLPTNVEEHLTLGEIGVEPEFAVELQKELEREFNLKIGINLIKTIDVKTLKEYNEGRVEILQKYLHDLKRAVDAMDQYEFIIPSEPITRLNDVKDGKPVYFMPPFEITYSGYKEMVKKFNRPVIGINWTKDMNKFETCKEFMKYMQVLMKKLEPNGKIDLVGYLDGKEGVSKLTQKGLVNKFAVIEIINDKRIKKEWTEEFLTQMVLIKFFPFSFPLTFQNKVIRAIKNEPDLNSKIAKIVSELKEIAGSGLIATDLDEIIHLLIKRAKFSYKYVAKKIGKIPDSYIKKVDKNVFKMLSGQLFIKYSDFENENEETEGTPDLNTLPDKNKPKEFFSIETLYCEDSITSELISNKIVESFK